MVVVRLINFSRRLASVVDVLDGDRDGGWGMIMGRWAVAASGLARDGRGVVTVWTCVTGGTREDVLGVPALLVFVAGAPESLLTSITSSGGGRG